MTSEATSKRKEDHIDICLNFPVQSQISSGFDNVFLIHKALPEVDFNDIDTSIRLFGKRLSFPLVVSGMTGGMKNVEKINRTIAEACQKTGIGMGVGSQRAMIENETMRGSYEIRKYAPDILLFGNLGMPQFMLGWGEGEARHAKESIGADVLAFHLNALQEIVQPEGDRNFSEGVVLLKRLKERCGFPIIAKETGAGFCREVVEKILFLDGVDVGGAGGTSFSAVEYYRNDEEGKELAHEFWNWGIPTAASVVESGKMKTIIATGGIRSGQDIARAIALGAHCAGIALPILECAMKGTGEAERALTRLERELRTVMFLCGCQTIEDLREMPVVITGFLREYLSERGYDTKSYAQRKR
jgi:isopentenyl-diphosphate delta-isomerase